MWRYTMRYKKLLFADFICVFGFILIELGLPTILARLTKELFLKIWTIFISKGFGWL